MSSDTEKRGMKMHKPSPIKDFISGGVGGVAVVLSGHPLDTIKVIFDLRTFSIIFMQHYATDSTEIASCQRFYGLF